MSAFVYLLLGSNLGNSLETLTRARHEISRLAGSIVTTSSIYKSAAWGKEDQPDFYNQAIKIQTSLPPEALLLTLLAIEKTAGRIRIDKWGPRVIDIDILFYGDLVLKSAHLTIPHPELPNRNFALVPLREIEPELVHPELQKTINELCETTPDRLPLEKLTL